MEEPEQKPEKTPEVKSWWRRCWMWVVGAVFVVIILVVAIIALVKDDTSQSSDDNSVATFTYSDSGERMISKSAAIQEGKILSNNQCEGDGVPYKLSESPMKADEFAIIIPYGLMVGGHVTPIDHQYFSPKDYASEPNAYEVRAMADSTLVGITARPKPFGQEYRLVFTISCTFFYYYDLLTSLSPEIQEIYDEAVSNPEAKKSINIPVEAGQLIGRIGGQTLDFAVWDTTKPLSGFIEAEHYSAERWKLFTVDPLDYYTDELKSFLLTRYSRTVPPISGKIDYDQDGRLIGNWFLQGTNGYEGDRQAANGAYWSTHLAFAPNIYVPDHFVVSIGDFETEKVGEGSQFVSPLNAPQPQDVTVETGLVKYDLSFWNYLDEKGATWNQNSLVKSISLQPFGPNKGCALVQMTKAREIKFEAFKDQACANVAGFTSSAKIYTR
jgi:hypothetical protein